MSDRTCVVDAHPVTGELKRGMCGRHYRAWWRENRLPLLDPNRLGPCTRECGRPARSGGLCGPCQANDWYHQNIHRAKTTQAVYRDARRDVNRQRAREWRAANPGRARAMCRRYYAAHRAEALADRRTYRQRNRTAVRMHNARRRARLRNAPVNDFTARQWRELKALYRGRCAYCGQRRRLTIDHVQPLSKGGSHTMSNIVPACQSCNSSKGDRAAPTFQPLLL